MPRQSLKERDCAWSVSFQRPRVGHRRRSYGSWPALREGGRVAVRRERGWWKSGEVLVGPGVGRAALCARGRRDLGRPPWFFRPELAYSYICPSQQGKQLFL